MKLKSPYLWLLGGLFLLSIANAAGRMPEGKKSSVSLPNISLSSQRLGEGDIFMARKEHYPALIKYLEAGRLNPNSEVVFNKIGIAYSQLQLNKEAIHALNRALKLNKRYAYAYNNLGSVYFAIREIGRAEKNFKKAIRLHPDVASFHFNLGAVYFEKKKFKQGETEFQRALALDRGILNGENVINLKAPAETLRNPERHYHLARVFASVKNVDKTIEYLQTASDLGFKVVETVDKEPIFDAVRQDQRFVTFIEDLRLLKSLSQWK
ncbi:MAG: tetratricopeptide repeat protein [Acidobacteria bacterium]|nr:tetratricopeptide repeat protein [Acidobacteriota bacterium]MBI3655947.1 tetratricopeptide repeat protein [Acidobacteriota bacterium]